MLYFEQKDYAAAAMQLDLAAGLGINDPHLFNFLGICYDRTNRLQRAIETYHRALKLDPNLAEGHLNLGFTYHRLGRESLAQKEYRRACELNPQFCKFVAPATTN
jgi:Flp pilus assembly protein TadD